MEVDIYVIIYIRYKDTLSNNIIYVVYLPNYVVLSQAYVYFAVS